MEIIIKYVLHNNKMKAIIAQFYKTEKKAIKRVLELKKFWRGKLSWYIICAKNGYFVISEKQARLCYPDLKFSYKDRIYFNEN